GISGAQERSRPGTIVCRVPVCSRLRAPRRARRAHAFFFQSSAHPPDLHSFPTRRSSDLRFGSARVVRAPSTGSILRPASSSTSRSEEHTSELQSRFDLVCRLLLEKKKGRGGSAKRRCRCPRPCCSSRAIRRCVTSLQLSA